MPTSENSPVKSLVAMTEILPEGQKVTGLEIQYGCPIAPESISIASFSVVGRKILRVAINDDSRAVIALSAEDPGASTLAREKSGDECLVSRKLPEILVRQSRDILSIDGKVVPAWKESVRVLVDRNSLADEFLSEVFCDAESGTQLQYSLFVPKDYDRKRSLPLVVFLHDRGVCGRGGNLGLIQGLGGAVWASPGEQKKHASLVLIPHYEKQIVNDSFGTQGQFDLTVKLINIICAKYRVDPARVYATGQSMGCMALLEIGSRYPKLFSAMLLCAGQWNPVRMPFLAKTRMWILVSEGDERAFNGMNACLRELRSAGADISECLIDGSAGLTALDSELKRQRDDPHGIKYTVFRKSSIVRDDPDLVTLPEMLKNHMSTWRIAYQLESLRDWLFE